MRYSLYAMSFAATFMLIGCGPERAASPVETDVESGASGIAITAAQPSPHFQAVLERLDVGGKSLNFQDHEGQREIWIGLLALLIGHADEFGLPGGLNAEAIVDASGIASAVASGHSIVKDGEVWLFRHYSHHPDGLPSVVRLLGDAMEFEMASALPANTDFAIEFRIDLSQLPATLRKIIGTNEFADALDEQLHADLPIGMTVAEVISLSDVRILAGIELMATQDDKMPVMPKSWVIKMQVNPQLIAACLDIIKEILGDPVVKGNEQRWSLPLPSFAHGEPALILQGGEVIYLVNDASHFEAMKGGGGSLGENAVYQAATNHFPSKGSFQAYLSPGVASAIRQWIGVAAADDGDLDWLVSAIGYILPDKPWSVCIASEKTGISTLMEIPFAFEGGTTAALGMMSVSSTGFVGARAWKRGSDRAACVMNTRNVQQAIRGHQHIYNLPIGTPINWDDILGPNGYLNAPVCPEGGTYTFSPMIPPVGRLACECSIPEHRLDSEDVVGW